MADGPFLVERSGDISFVPLHKVQTVILWASTIKFMIFQASTSFFIYKYPAIFYICLAYQLVEYWFMQSGDSDDISGRERKSVPHKRSRGRMPLMLACILGFGFGFMQFELLWAHVEFYDYSQTYRDQSANVDARQVADASQIRFNKGTEVDTKRGVAYRTGSANYCIAPIVQSTATTTTTAAGMKEVVNFWAVGQNCCGTEDGSFTCDQAANKGTHAGAVISEGGIIAPNWVLGAYEKARLKVRI